MELFYTMADFKLVKILLPQHHHFGKDITINNGKTKITASVGVNIHCVEEPTKSIKLILLQQNFFPLRFFSKRILISIKSLSIFKYTNKIILSKFN